MKIIPSIFLVADLDEGSSLFEFGLKFLKYGLIGLGAFLSILSFILIVLEARKPAPRTNILNQVKGFRQFALLMTALGVVSSAISLFNPDFKEKYKPAWSGKYLAFRKNHSLPITMLSVTKLIGKRKNS